MITNKELKMCSEQIFSSSAKYQVPFFGREKAIEEMLKLTNNLRPAETIVISQPLGTGKTFLVNYMINSGGLAVPKGSSFLTVRGIADDPDCMEEFSGDTLIVDEADIKTPVKKLIKGIDLLADYLKKSGRKAILLGDYSLKNGNISGKLKNTIPLLNFGDMDKEFLKGVIEQRFQYFINFEEFHIEEVMELELLEYLAPDWMKAVNNFRGIFSVMQQVVANEKYIRYNNEKAFLTVDMFYDFLCKDRLLELDEEQEIFLEILRTYIREIYPKGNGITAGFTVEELYELAMNNGLKKNLQEFTEDILYSFATVGLLVSVGIPQYDGEGTTFIRRPAPYVPSLRLLLSVR